MQDIRQETLNECTRAEQSASVVLWEIDLTEVGGERYFFCNEQNEKGEPVTWQGPRRRLTSLRSRLQFRLSSSRPFCCCLRRSLTICFARIFRPNAT